MYENNTSTLYDLNGTKPSLISLRTFVFTFAISVLNGCCEKISRWVSDHFVLRDAAVEMIMV